MSILKISFLFILFIVLTIATQVGGVVLLISLFAYSIFSKKTTQRAGKLILAFALFVIIYGLATFLITPMIAQKFGRKALPIVKDDHFKPLTIWTCLLNRHYVKPELYQFMLDVSEEMNRQHPDVIIAYLDANFPFFNGFPLFPHLSHDDGEKLDLAFFYKEIITGKELNKVAPSFIGYGVSEKPKKGEIDKPSECEKMGYWQYNILESIILQPEKPALEFDDKRTSALLKLLNEIKSIRKIFLEPHLVHRLNLENEEKIRFHGCHAVRHDDHIHIQL
jgi:hypothetical protein